MNDELHALYLADQSDRVGATAGSSPDWSSLVERDRARRQRARELISAGVCTDGDDWFHAAMLFQHGETLDDYLQARTLATEAAARGHARGPWLAAAAHDRWLMRQGQPQKYGTQYVVDGARWRLWQVDPSTTDAERAEVGVPSLHELELRAEDLTRRSPPPPIARIGELAARLCSLEGADLQVVVIAAPDAPDAPTSEPVEADERIPTPALAEGLSVRKRGIGWCAVDNQGRVRLFWDRMQLPAGVPFIYGWRWSPERVRLEAMDVSHRSGILISGADDGFERLVVRGEPGEVWLVGGVLPAEELCRLAAALVSGADDGTRYPLRSHCSTRSRFGSHV